MRPLEDDRMSSNNPTVCSGLDSDSDSDSESFTSSTSSTLGSDVLPAAARYTATGPSAHDDEYAPPHNTLATERNPSAAPRSTTRNLTRTTSAPSPAPPPLSSRHLTGTTRVPATLDTVPSPSTSWASGTSTLTTTQSPPGRLPTHRGLAASSSVRETSDGRPRGVRPPGLTLPDGWKPPYETRFPTENDY
jgi:hypothetical protein